MDDDAYPRRDWLKNAVKTLWCSRCRSSWRPGDYSSKQFLLSKGLRRGLLSKISGGNPERYWPVGKIREVDDWPSVNLLVRRDIFEKIGGFNSAYWPERIQNSVSIL